MFFGIEAQSSCPLCGIVSQGKGGKGMTHFMDNDAIEHHYNDGYVADKAIYIQIAILIPFLASRTYACLHAI